MLSVFPTLLAYPLIGAFLLRVSLGLFLLFLASKNVREIKGGVQISKFALPVAVVEIVCGSLLVAGLFTQVAALLTALVFFVAVFMPKENSTDTKKSFFYLLVIGVSLSILFIGPGTFALDLPL